MSKIDVSVIEEIAVKAGQEIMEVYSQEGEMAITVKADSSPLTLADQKAHNLIVAQLTQFYPDIPILSEESTAIEFDTRQSWSRYWLVDPLDGTKEFISRNGEFTVNIALIEEGRPIIGVVHVPVQKMTYAGQVGKGASKTSSDGLRTAIQCSSMANPPSSIRVVASRNHRGEVVDKLIADIANTYVEPQVLSMGSSLKMCLLAEGKADFYPRLAPTSEWDTAAAHAVMAAAGGEIVDLDFEPLRYNSKDSLLNPHFIAIADMTFPWQRLVEAALTDSERDH